jgi:hypothetical protein
MHLSRRKASPSEQIQTLRDSNAALQSDQTRLKTQIAGLETERDRLKQQNMFLRVTISVLLGITAGMAIGMVGAAAVTLLTAAITVSTAVIAVSIAILAYLRR